MILGSCLCDSIRFELAEDPTWAHHCHCQRCRKSGGSAFATNLFVPIKALRFTQGEAFLASYRPPDAERFTHVFCKTCGSSLPFRNVDRGVAVIPMGSLDSDPQHPPDAHIFVGSMASWYTITDSLPQHELHHRDTVKNAGPDK